MESSKDAADAVKLNWLIINISLKIKHLVMDFTPSVNAAETRKNELGQKLLVLLKEKSAQDVKKIFL